MKPLLLHSLFSWSSYDSSDGHLVEMTSSQLRVHQASLKAVLVMWTCLHTSPVVCPKGDLYPIGDRSLTLLPQVREEMHFDFSPERDTELLLKE